MGVLKQSLVVLITAIIVTNIPKWFEPGLSPIVEGDFPPEFMEVAETFRRNIESGKDMGAAFAVYLDGEPIIDMWAGYADRESGRRWRNNTITTGYSAGKAALAILYALMVDRGYIEYNKPIKDYWLGFGQKNKDNITVEMFLSHKAGLPYLNNTIYLRDLQDNPKRLEQFLEEQEPVWPPGSMYGYHTQTFGLYLDKLLQKVDPKGRDTATAFKEDIADPFGIDYFMKLPRTEYYRTARVQQSSLWSNIFDLFSSTTGTKFIYNYLTNHMARKSVMVFRELADIVNSMNNPELREIVMSSVMGTGTARGLAKLYSIIASGGSYKGKQLLSPKVIQELCEQMTEGPEVVLNHQGVQWARGIKILKNPNGEKVYGHSGYGGQLAYADPTNRLGIAYLTNYLSMFPGNDPRFRDLRSGVYRNLDRYLSRVKKLVQ